MQRPETSRELRKENSGFGLVKMWNYLIHRVFLWPKFEDQEVGLRLAYIGSINDEILTKSELALKFIEFLKFNYCNALADRYNIDIDFKNSENFEILKQIAIARACLLKGNEPDLDKAASIVFDDFRAGRLGRITLEEITE